MSTSTGGGIGLEARERVRARGLEDAAAGRTLPKLRASPLPDAASISPAPPPTPFRPAVRLAICAAVLVLAGVSVLPLGRLAADWWAVVRVVGDVAPQPARSFDWVRWEDDDGEIVAAYVDARGTAYAAGLREGALLYQADYQQFFQPEDLQRAIEGAGAGRVLTYEVVQGDALVAIDVPLTRYPVFLYPLSRSLWQASVWGFAVAGFLHVLALLVVGPLLVRGRRARRSVVLVGVASAWALGNLARLLAIAVFGAPMSGTTYEFAFRVLTAVALAGWVLFPAVLLRNVLLDGPRLAAATRAVRWALYVPPLLLGGALGAALLVGRIGPVTVDALTAPALFYACCYVAAAAGLALLVRRAAHESDGPTASAWSRIGSGFALVAATVGALFAFGPIPALAQADPQTGGWVVLSVQLMALLPVGLVAQATLRYGRTEAVVGRALAYAAVLGVFFFAFVGGMWVLDRVSALQVVSPAVRAGGWAVVLLAVGERLVWPLRHRLRRALATERQRARQGLARFGEGLREHVAPAPLADATTAAVGDGLGARSAVLLLRPPVGEPLVVGAFGATLTPQSRRAALQAGEEVEAAGRVWAQNAELRELALSPAADATFRRLGVSLAVPVVRRADAEAGDAGSGAGVLLVGRKASRGAVYDLDDVDLLRGLCGQIALAVERLRLVEREKALVREGAEARLVALRAQINPHFLFNALNTIAALIAERPEEAERAVEDLAVLFRQVLGAEGRSFWPLSDELGLVRRYLALEQARFGDHLAVALDVADGAADRPVPAFAVQTLVENAVKHGIERQRGGGAVQITARLLAPDASGDRPLEVVVADTGAGLPALFATAAVLGPDVLGPDGAAPPASSDVPPAFFGTGLRNVHGRLLTLYGRSDLLRLQSAPGDGTTARLLLPPDAAPQ